MKTGHKKSDIIVLLITLAATVFICGSTRAAEETLEDFERELIAEMEEGYASESSETLYKEARDYYNRREYTKALRVLDRLLIEEPGHKMALELKNLSQMRLDLAEKKQEDVERYKKVKALMKEAEAAYHDKEFEKSIAIYQDLKIIEPARRDRFNELIKQSELGHIAYISAKTDDRVDVKTDMILKKVKDAYIDTTIRPADPSGRKQHGRGLTEDEIRMEELRRKANEVIPVVDFNEAQIKDVLKYLSKISGVNIVIDDKATALTETITLYLKDATLLEILETVLRTKGLVYQLEKNLIWITSKAQLRSEEVVVKVYDVQDLIGRLYNFPGAKLKSNTGDEKGGEEIEED